MTDAEIIRPKTKSDVAAAKDLIIAYQAWLGVDLCFQGFDREMAEFPKGYEPPEGCLLLARIDGEAAGVVGLKRLDGETCEMKRLFVTPAHWGGGLGRRLAEGILAEGAALGYRRMRLDTLERLGAAISLYRSLGFKPIAPYNVNADPSTRYFERDLAAGG